MFCDKLKKKVSDKGVASRVRPTIYNAQAVLDRDFDKLVIDPSFKYGCVL